MGTRDGAGRRRRTGRPHCRDRPGPPRRADAPGGAAAELSSLPRATVISTRSMEMFRSWGLEERDPRWCPDVEWLLWLCETLADAAAGSGRAVGLPDAGAGRSAQPDRPGVRAAGPPRAGTAGPPARTAGARRSYSAQRWLMSSTERTPYG